MYQLQFKGSVSLPATHLAFFFFSNLSGMERDISSFCDYYTSFIPNNLEIYKVLIKNPLTIRIYGC